MLTEDEEFILSKILNLVESSEHFDNPQLVRVLDKLYNDFQINLADRIIQEYYGAEYE